MKEDKILSLHLGGFGVNMSNSYWTRLLIDNSIDITSMSTVNKSELNNFAIEKDDKYTPLAILADSDPKSIDYITSNYFKKDFFNDLIYNNDSTVNFSNGYYKEKTFKNKVEEFIRLNFEKYEIKEIHVFSSLIGGFGSALTPSIQKSVKELFGNIKITNFCLIPSGYMSSNSLEYYNTILSLRYLLNDLSDSLIYFDNKSFLDKQFAYTYDEINDLISFVPFTNISKIGVTDNKIYTAGFSNDENIDLAIKQASSIDYHMFTSATNFLKKSSHINVRFNKEIDINHLNLNSFCTYSTTKINEIIPEVVEISHHNGIIDSLERLLNNYEEMWRRRAYCHTYIADGCDEDELSESYNIVFNECEKIRLRFN